MVIDVCANGASRANEIANKALARLDIDSFGLDFTDRRILETIIKKFHGGPVGLDTIAAATSESRDTIEDVYEPYLLQLGFIMRTPRGRVVTELGYNHLGIAYNKSRAEEIALFTSEN